MQKIEWTLCGYDRQSEELADEIVLRGATPELLRALLGAGEEAAIDESWPVSGEILSRLAAAFGVAPQGERYDYFLQAWST